MPDLRYQRRIASLLMGVGENKVRFSPDRLEEISEAVTRREIEQLIKRGAIQSKPKRGVSRGKSRARERRGKRRGSGSVKGSRHARLDNKKRWIRKIRALRRRLKQMRARGVVSKRSYRELYRRLSRFESVRQLSAQVKRKADKGGK